MINCKNNESNLSTSDKQIHVFDYETSLKFKIIKEGSQSSLMKLESDYVMKGRMYCELLPYAKYLADFYNSGYGCEMTANALIATCLFKYRNNEPQFPERHHLNLLNENEKKEVFYYLEKGALLGDNGCLLKLSEIYKNGYGVEIDLIKADKYYSKINYKK